MSQAPAERIRIEAGEEVRPTLKGREFQEQCRWHAGTGRLPALFIGEPGTGKTRKAKALKDDPVIKSIMGVDDILAFIVPSQQATEESINGFPLGDKSTNPPQVIYALPKYCVDRPVLLIVDEVGKAKEPVRNCLYPWLSYDEQINGHTLNPKSLVIMLDNDVTHKAGSRSLDNAIKGRYADYNYKPEISEWIADYAMPRVNSGRMGIEVVDYLRANPDELNIFDPASKTHGQPCPRKWAAVGRGLMTTDSVEVKYRGFRGAVGMVAATKFIDFLKNRAQLATLEDLAEKAAAIPIPDSLHDAYRMARMLLGVFKSSKGRFSTSEGTQLALGAAVVTGRLAEAGHGEVAAWIMRGAMEHASAVKGDALLLTPGVGQMVQSFPALKGFLESLGRVETAR